MIDKKCGLFMLQTEPASESDVHVILSAMLDVVIQVILTIDRILPVTVSSRYHMFCP